METQEFSLEKYHDFVYYDQLEWELWKSRGDPVLHI